MTCIENFVKIRYVVFEMSELTYRERHICTGVYAYGQTCGQTETRRLKTQVRKTQVHICNGGNGAFLEYLQEATQSNMADVQRLNRGGQIRRPKNGT